MLRGKRRGKAQRVMILTMQARGLHSNPQHPHKSQAWLCKPTTPVLWVRERKVLDA